jgi:hypothetical protein
VFRSSDPRGDTFEITHLPADIMDLFQDDEVVRITRNRYISMT